MLNLPSWLAKEAPWLKIFGDQNQPKIDQAIEFVIAGGILSGSQD